MIIQKIFTSSAIVLSLLSISLLSYSAPTSVSTGKYITITNNTGSSQKFYFELSNQPKYVITQTLMNKFKALTYPCSFPASPYVGQGNSQTCSFTMPDGQSQNMPLKYYNLQTLSLAVSAGDNHYPQGNCNTTMGEIYINNSTDSYDISLVNGQNFNMKIVPSHSGAQPINLNTDTLSAIKSIHGIYPPGCDTCTAGRGAPDSKANPAKNTQNCPAYPSGTMDAGSCCNV
jgi:hypothetical protein